MHSRTILFYTATLTLTLSALTMNADEDALWKSKQIADWSDSDAKEFLAGSPWVKKFTPTMKQAQNENAGRQRGMGRGGMGGGGMGGGIGGIGIGIPGIGMGRRGGGYPGGGYPNGTGDPGAGQNRRNENLEPPQVTLRWESATPVRAAELKVHDNDAPTLDESHYTIAVYGIPERFLIGDRKNLANALKSKAVIKRDGKKDLKASSAEVIDRPDGPVVVYSFSRNTEISKGDRRLEFDAEIGRLGLTQSFFTEDMSWQGKLEL